MREHGFCEEEITESLVDDPPTDLDYELRQLTSVRKMNTPEWKANHRKLLEQISKNIREICQENGIAEEPYPLVCLSCRKIVQSDEHDNYYCDCHDERKAGEKPS